MIILGIDPGTATTGFGLVQKDKSGLRCLKYGTIQTSKAQRSGKRLEKIFNELTKIIKQYKPDKAAIERLFFFKNIKTALPVSEARGVCLLALSKAKLPVSEFTPLEVKMAICGYGRAEKQQVQKMVQKILQLKEPPRPDDASDGIALALTKTFATESKLFHSAS